MNDAVNHPRHYKLFPDMEAIDVIEAALTPEEFRGYLKGSCLKYRLRAGSKNDTQEDIAKATWFQNRAAHTYAKRSSETRPQVQPELSHRVTRPADESEGSHQGAAR